MTIIFAARKTPPIMKGSDIMELIIIAVLIGVLALLGFGIVWVVLKTVREIISGIFGAITARIRK